MGHGIAYLLAAAGHEVGVFEPSADVRASLPQRLQVDRRAARRRSGAARAHLGARPARRRGRRRRRSCSRRRRRSCRSSSRSSPSSKALTAPDTILASNSSAIPIDRDRPPPQAPRARGRHAFLEPAASRAAGRGDPDRSDQRRTSCARRCDLLRDAGKKPVHVAATFPGFIGNRLQHALKREAIALVAAGVCDAETHRHRGEGAASARAWRCSGRWSSPTSSASTSRSTSSDVLVADLDRTAGPHPFLREKVAAGKLGMRTGEGFRRWTPEQADAVRERLRRFLAEQAKAEEDEDVATLRRSLPPKRKSRATCSTSSDAKLDWVCAFAGTSVLGITPSAIPP